MCPTAVTSVPVPAPAVDKAAAAVAAVNLASQAPAAAAPAASSNSKKTPIQAAVDAVTAPAALAREDRVAAAEALAKLALTSPADSAAAVATLVAAAAAADASPQAKEGVALGLTALAKAGGAGVEAHTAAVGLPALFTLAGDKAAPVREAAEEGLTLILSALSPAGLRFVLPAILDATDHAKAWQTKVAALRALGELSAAHPAAVAALVPTIIPAASYAVSDAKPDVKSAAMAALDAVAKTIGNADLDAFIPALVSCIARPDEVPECVHKLGATTFVQAVEAPTLSLMVPLLLRGLRERQTAVRRKAALITDNMAKLVDSPLDAAVFLPRLLPDVRKMAEEVSDPEARTVAERTVKTLVSVGAEGDISQLADKYKPACPVATKAALVKALADAGVDAAAPGVCAVVDYAAAAGTSLADAKAFLGEEWAPIEPFLAPTLGGDAAKAAAVTKAFLRACEVAAEERVEEADDDEGEDLCNCEFSLAYGGLILLNNARLRLKRGMRYGLCGPNGVGKSTLMRAIANGQLDGFPPADQLRTVYVEHDIDASQAETPVLDFIVADANVVATTAPSKEEVAKVLSSVGFTAEMQADPVASLSGGWKMKLALARAMLMKADILLLDEPTNHLDVSNVAWLENYLTSLTDVTSMIVSHDSGFLDHVCTHVIHYESRKLRRYKGNLSEFVKQVPSAKAYYELGASSIKFILPEPSFLEGVKSKDRAILKMKDVTFAYPGTERTVLTGVTVQCCLNSRVAVTGANGAGKSTMIKLLTGEMEPVDGDVWKHPNLRIAYVAQHAFHHLEMHLEKTPNEYIRWRYAIGEDRENLSKVDRVLTEEEEEALRQPFKMEDGSKRVVDKLVGRRKLKRDYEYEVQWQGHRPEDNTWMPRDVLERRGFSKLVTEVDVKEAARLGLHARPLTLAQVEKHLQDLGVDPEFGTHSHIRGLSGGQKVKVVIAAAMWQSPHMLILDEPTNYLDRESLGALADAIKDYGGGVVMITHSREFADALCPEKWHVADGTLAATGQPAALLEAAKLEWKRQEETVDAFGNTVKIKAPKKTLSNKDKKKQAKARAMRKERGEEVTDSDEDAW
jgi:elongation factor 3